MIRHFAKLFRATLTALLMPVAMAGATIAGPLEDAFEAYGHGEYATANRLWRPLAEKGDALAQLYIAMAFHDGLGVPQDYDEAVKWCRKAADQGQKNAQAYLGLLYEWGEGVPQDYVQAYMWLNLAASHERMADAVEHRDKVASKMTPAQIAEAQKLAREWKPKPER
jgi:TPR repeat protein